MGYKGRFIGILVAVLTHVWWIIYGFLKNNYIYTMDIIVHISSFSIELMVLYWFGKKLDKYKFLSERDFLTKLYNRRYVFDIFSKLTNHLIPSGKINIFVIDINDFKIINDTHGHKKGDSVIRGISKNLVRDMRETDIVARLGGDEFLLIVPDEEIFPTEVVFSRIEKSLDRLSIKQGVDISISIGKSVYPDDGEILDDLIKLADKRMYQHKFNNKKNSRKENHYKPNFEINN